MIRATDTSSGDWKDIYRLLVTSLRTSSVHFQQLTVESATVGLWGLSKTHATSQGTSFPGRVVAPDDRSSVTEWVYWGDLLLRTFDGASSAAAVAAALGIQESSVLHFQPLSAPLLPAHAVIVDESRKQLLLLVRGTSSWADCLTDIVAHTEPVGSGHAHSGMLDCARSVLQHCVPIMQQQLEKTPGYRIHCLGHSLGGGVAALAAYLLRTSPDRREQLQAASGVMATGFGTPPVMTEGLAESVSSFTRTLVHDCDLVPRTCVASLAVLRAQLEAEKDAVYANNTLLSSLKSSGVLEGGVSLLGTVATAALASKLVPGAGAAGKSRWMAAGLQVGASLLLNTAKQVHQDVMAAAPAQQPPTTSGTNTVGKTTAGTACSAGLQSCSSADGSQAAGGTTSAGSTGTFGFAAMRQAVAAAAATAAAGQMQNASQASTQQRPLVQQQQQQQQQPSCDGFRSDTNQTQEQRYQEEEQAAKVCLYCPGQLWHLRKCTGATEDGGGSYELVQAVEPGTERFGGKIWVKRSMLSDHYLNQHLRALLQLQAQLVEQAALNA